MSAVSTATAKDRRKPKAKKVEPPKQVVVVHKQVQAANKPPMKLLREKEAMARVGLRPTRFRELVASGVIPAPVDITPGGRAIGYVESELEEFISSRIRARDGAA